MHQGHPNPLEGIQPAVKAALTRAYKEGSKSRMVRAADLISLPGMKKAPKKRIAAILEPSDEGLVDGSGETLAENEEENSSDTEELGKPLYLMQVFMDLPPPKKKKNVLLQSEMCLAWTKKKRGGQSMIGNQGSTKKKNRD